MHIRTFCAANSGEGFVSFFPMLTDEENQRIYYIKGGPGSGKSTLLKRLANMAKNAELIYCSGDPSSLDAVVLPDQNAVVFDATAPHSFEPKYAGVGGNLIDLGEGWNPQKMNKEKIIELSDQKSAIYKSCYNILHGAKKIFDGVFYPLMRHLDCDRLFNIGDRILKQYALWEKRPHKATVSHRFLSAISPNGMLTLTETMMQLGERIILLEDRWICAHILLKYLHQKLTENGVNHIIGAHPLLGKETIHHIIVPEANLSIVTKDGLFPIDLTEECITRKIVIQNYIDKAFLDEHKNKLSFIKRLLKELLDLACETLNSARNLHMEIEREYAFGTDFSATEHLKEKLIYDLFGKT